MYVRSESALALEGKGFEEGALLPMVVSDEPKDDNDEIVDENADDLIASFKRRGEVVDRSRDEAFAYLQQIARTPRLTHDKEVELFEQFDSARQRVAELLDLLPSVILEKVRSEEGKRRYQATGQTNRGLWWSPMDIVQILERVQKEIKAYFSKHCSTEEEWLAKLWEALDAAAKQMIEVRVKIVRANLL